MSVQTSQNLKHRHNTWTSDVYNTSGTRVNNTGGMSGNATGSVSGYGLIRSSGGTASGNCSLFRQTQAGAGQESSAGYGFSIDVSHTHNMQHIHSITADGGDESRPDNYTMKVWKRIS